MSTGDSWLEMAAAAAFPQTWVLWLPCFPLACYLQGPANICIFDPCFNMSYCFLCAYHVPEGTWDGSLIYTVSFTLHDNEETRHYYSLFDIKASEDQKT